MFAIAIYDKQSNDLFLYRDRIGIKPFYYFWDGENFAFASELNALKHLSFIKLEIDKNAIYHFLHLGFIPAPLSIYKTIRKMHSGTVIKISKSNLDLYNYWTIEKNITKDIVTNEKEAKLKLKELLYKSVQYQMKSDVPFGVFLSGGIDSTIITANAVQSSSNKINSFSIGFEENKFNESVYAKKIANHLGTDHHEFIVTYKDAMDLIETSLEVYNEPYADSSAIPTLLVSKLAKKYVSVALSGDGGDELFLGYGAYNWAKRLDHPWVKHLRNPIANFLKISKTKFQKHANHFNYPNETLKYSHIFSQEQKMFSLNEIDNLLSEDMSNINEVKELKLFHDFSNSINNLKRKLTPEETQALFDLNFYLQDDLLVKVDRASMHYSLETRVPFLDHNLIEFALNLSPDLKIKNGVSKYLLKELLNDYLPKYFFDRPKQGFSIPLEGWLKKELHYLIEENLSRTVIEKYNIVKFEKVELLIKQFNSGKSYLYNKIWLLIVLHNWLLKNAN